MVGDPTALRGALGELQGEIARLRIKSRSGDIQPHAALSLIIRALLLVIDDDPDRAGLRETPDRVARAWLEFLSPATDRLDTAFEAVQTDQLVVLQGHRVWSMCEHHLLPFWCDITIGYLPDRYVLGVSKLARIANLHAARLQLQERLTRDISAHVADATGNEGDSTWEPNANVAVLGRGEHLCMAMRGVKSTGRLVTSSLLGKFRDNPALRAEFFALANGHT